jgi:thiol-disulfide isomerase/thioredoxin
MSRSTPMALVLLAVIACSRGGVAPGEAGAPVVEPAGPETGSSAPAPAILGAEGELALPTMAGEPTRLKDHGAPVTVIALWATWCAPCLEELPYVEALYQIYRDDPEVNVLAVNIDEPELRDKVLAMVADLGLTLPMLVDGEPLMARVVAGKQIGLPLLVVIDRTFQIHRRTGFQVGISRDDYLAEKRALVGAALRGEPPDEVGAAPKLLGRPPAGTSFQMKVPKVPADQMDDVIAQLRAGFADAWPEMTEAELDAMIESIAVAMRRGDDEVELQF